MDYRSKHLKISQSQDPNSGTAEFCTSCYRSISSEIRECQECGKSYDYTVAIISGILGASIGGLTVAHIVNALWKLPR